MAHEYTDAEALNEIAAGLGLYHTDPENNPAEGVLADISDYVLGTGRSVTTPEGA